MEKTETMFKEINEMGAKLIAIVTDSAPSYAAARYGFINFKNYLFYIILLKFIFLDVDFDLNIQLLPFFHAMLTK
jgi:hypothetical protein